jgi:N-acetylglucosaminyldiphosphoundecaprenol N-acetyl-beta-D-mannosaminyltransferase
MLAMCAHSLKKGYRHFFWGGGPGVADKLAERLSQRFPGLQVVGTMSPPFRATAEVESASTLEQLNRANPHVIWVGLGAPKQEKWMAKHVGKLGANALIGVGAAFDFYAGLKPQAPRWMRQSGLEWLYRFATEPRRLGPRYLKTNPRFIALIFSEVLKRKL